MCGILITFSVRAVEPCKATFVSPTVGVLFPIVVFAFCGFDHSVANMMYIYYFGECSWRIVGYILLAIAGNIVGGVLYPTFLLVKSKLDKKYGE